MVDDSELEELRRRKLQELQDQAQEGSQEDAQQEQQIEAKKKALLRQALEPEARERLTRLRMARPDVAENLTNQILQLAMSGRLQSKITDDQLKQILARSQENRRDINIERR